MTEPVLGHAANPAGVTHRVASVPVCVSAFVASSTNPVDVVDAVLLEGTICPVELTSRILPTSSTAERIHLRFDVLLIKKMPPYDISLIGATTSLRNRVTMKAPPQQ